MAEYFQSPNSKKKFNSNIRQLDVCKTFPLNELSNNNFCCNYNLKRKKKTLLKALALKDEMHFFIPGQIIF